jgi:enoyl-CoA hydratase
MASRPASAGAKREENRPCHSVRIDLRKGKDAAYRQDIGRAVYEALVGIGVPKNDRFQVVGEHAADDFLFDPDYLGVHRSDDLVMIQITWNEGRTVEQKKALYKAIAEGLTKLGIRPEDVLINLVEVKKENWSYGRGVAQYVSPHPAADTNLVEVPLASGATLTVERRGKVALFGLNRPQIHNRIDPVTFRALAKAYHDYDHDPSLRAAVLFGHGEHFSRGIDVDGFRSLVVSQQPWIPSQETIDPLAKRLPFLSKPLVVAVHGDTWNMAHELFPVADIRVAAADTNFGQDENSHGRFPGGGATIRFVREAGWANAMRYMLTGDHLTAAEAYRMGTVQEVSPTADAALEQAIDFAGKIADCGPLGIKTSLASAHLAADPVEAAALTQLDAQFGALFHTRDFQEGRDAEAEGRRPVYR